MVYFEFEYIKEEINKEQKELEKRQKEEEKQNRSSIPKVPNYNNIISSATRSMPKVSIPKV